MARLNRSEIRALEDLGLTEATARRLLADATASGPGYARMHPEFATRGKNYADALSRIYPTHDERTRIAGVLGESAAERAELLRTELHAAADAADAAEAAEDHATLEDAIVAMDVLSESLFDIYQAFEEGGEDLEEGATPPAHEELAVTVAMAMTGRYEMPDMIERARHILAGAGYSERLSDEEVWEIAEREYHARRALLVRLREKAAQRKIAEPARVMHALAIVRAMKVPEAIRAKLGYKLLPLPLAPNLGHGPRAMRSLVQAGLPAPLAYAMVR